MSWAVGYDKEWDRDIGYGVPSICDHPECNKKIDRGLSYVCGGEPYGGEHGCGLFFCGEHLSYHHKVGRFLCDKCPNDDQDDCYTPTPDTQEWINHKLTDESWSDWRVENPEEVKKLKGDTR